ncbi:hypothetical protein [Pseudomonas serbica]|uniref:hypothetical protein n=1 Tax=Pseudomonas serbica TaxID=2965074 RepID=UPI00237A147B|nr:hypothetical protein [Pseudomonas serbica]
MKIQLDGGGKLFKDAPKQKWNGDNLLQTALFAGHRMMAITDDKGGYKLNYLNYESGQLKTMADAKAAGPEFANSVLNDMLSLIQTVPESAPATPSL